jgi:anthranilate synthase component 1
MELSRFPDRETFCGLARSYNVIPLCTEVLADTETPVSLLRKYYHRPSLFLFESVEGGERWGRYSFLGISARARVRVYNDRVEIENGGRRTVSHRGNMVSVLREFMTAYRPAPVDGLPRFWGGLVGFFTYETVSFFEKVPHDFPGDKPLAQFMIPDELIIFDNIRHTLLAVVITFARDGIPSATLYEKAAARMAVLLDGIRRPTPAQAASPADAAGRLTPAVSAAEFRRRVTRVKEHILAGDIIQAVISQPFICRPAPDPWMLYRVQRFVNPSPYLFYLQLDGTTLIGSSPETMVRLENGVCTLRPIAGTRPRGDGEQEDRRLADELLQDEKERAEHLMLVDLGRNDLGRVAETGSVQVTDLMVVERYSHVMHLVSNIQCDLETGLDAWDLLAATFPAGTLSGAPKVRAMEIIYDVEKRPRGPYGGAVGYVSFSGNMDLAIIIRTASIEDGALTLQAGAGIVADSDPESERRETVNKAMAIEKALRLAARHAGAGGDCAS